MGNDLITQSINVIFFSCIAGIGFTFGAWVFCKLCRWLPIEVTIINKFNCDEGIRVGLDGAATGESDDVC